MSTGIMVAVSTCGTLMSHGAKSGEIMKLMAMPTTHTQAVAGRQEDWNQLPLASSLLTASCASASS